MEKATTVWRMYDGKTGHDRQSQGLVEALADLYALRVCNLDARNISLASWWWIRGRFPAGDHCPDPTLIIGAGRRCQWPMLAARRARGGRLIYLMRPVLPVALFDLCLVPRHDDTPASGHVTLTDGALNTMTPSGDHDPTHGVILIGGPSRHYGWDEARLCAQIGEILARDTRCRWTLADSRRTPRSTAARLAACATADTTFVSCAGTDPAWLARALARCGRVWVTQDSVSMIFEALTAGAAVGLLDVPARRDDRLTRLAADLVRRELVVDFDAWHAGRALCPPAAPLREARRCAEFVGRRWLTAAPGGAP